MRKILKAGLCGFAAVMLITGCSKAEKTDATTTANESGAGETTEESKEEISRGTITLGEYKGVAVTVEKAAVSDLELEATIQNILEGNPDYEDDASGPAVSGDIVNINYVGYKDGEAFEGGSAEGFDLTLGSGQFIPGFEDGLIGAKKGEKKSLNLTFPEQYQSADLAGQEVVFEVTVNSIRGRKEAVLNEEFVKKVSPADENVEQFKEGVKESILSQKQQDIDQLKENNVVDAVAANATIELNQAAVDEVYETQLSQYTQAASYYGMELKDYALAAYGMDEETFKSELKKVAETIVTQELILTAVAEKENFEITDEDRNSLAERYGYVDGQSLIDAIGAEDTDKMAKLHKALAFLVDNASVTEVDAVALAPSSVEESNPEAEEASLEEAAEESSSKASSSEETEAAAETTAKAE